MILQCDTENYFGGHIFDPGFERPNHNGLMPFPGCRSDNSIKVFCFQQFFPCIVIAGKYLRHLFPTLTDYLFCHAEHVVIYVTNGYEFHIISSQ